jgi:hypothetical protein
MGVLGIAIVLAVITFIMLMARRAGTGRPDQAGDSGMTTFADGGSDMGGGYGHHDSGGDDGGHGGNDGGDGGDAAGGGDSGAGDGGGGGDGGGH